MPISDGEDSPVPRQRQRTLLCRYVKLEHLPVIFILFIAFSIYAEFLFLHCIRLLGEPSPGPEKQGAKTQLVVFHIFFLLQAFCFERCFHTDPGWVPEGQGWELYSGELSQSMLKEKKQTGERRQCKWCMRFKPDRCHHCRQCVIPERAEQGRCVLKMDHHCPWVNNCIGFKNHKYFFLLLVYSLCALIIVSTCMFDSLWWSTRFDVKTHIMVLLFVGEVMACILCVILAVFLSFHTMLMCCAYTTLEYIEFNKKPQNQEATFTCLIPPKSPYDEGLYKNICAVLGPRPLCWLIPFCSFPEDVEGQSVLKFDRNEADQQDWLGCSSCLGDRGSASAAPPEPEATPQEPEPAHQEPVRAA